VSLHIQFYTLFAMVASGAGLGVVFDVYRVLARHFRLSRWVYALLDLVYWLLATAAVFAVLFHSNEGQIRLFVFIGICAGVWLYLRLFSSVVMKLVRWLIVLVQRTILLIKKIIDLFIVTPILWLYKLVIIILGFLAALSIFLGKIVLQLLYPLQFLYLRLIHPWIRRIQVHPLILTGFRRLSDWWKKR
jgi:spore cortex biosynthesis protein YabQ